MQAREVFSPQAGGGASDDSQANLASPQAVWEQLFSTSGNSPTQLLYILEVREGGKEGRREGGRGGGPLNLPVMPTEAQVESD